MKEDITAMKKMIAIDLDGTLLNTKSEISAQNRQALIRAKEAGYIVTICTGRATFDVKSFLGIWTFPLLRQMEELSIQKGTSSSAESPLIKKLEDVLQRN